MKFKLLEGCFEATCFLDFIDLSRTKEIKIIEKEYSESILEYLKKITFLNLERFSITKEILKIQNSQGSVLEEKDLMDFLNKNKTIKMLKIDFPALNLQLLKKIGEEFSSFASSRTKFIYCNNLFTKKTLDKNVYKIHCPIEKRFSLLEKYKKMKNLNTIDFDFGSNSPFQLKDDFLISIVKQNPITKFKIPCSLISLKTFQLCQMELKNLKILNISNCFELTEFDLTFIFQSFLRLEKISISNLLLSDDCLEALSSLKELRSLDLSRNKEILSFHKQKHNDEHKYFDWFEKKFMEKKWNLDYLNLKGFKFSPIFLTQLYTADFFQYLKILEIETNDDSKDWFGKQKNRGPHQKFYINDDKYSNKFFSKKVLLNLTYTLINLKSIKILKNALKDHTSVSLKMFNLLLSRGALKEILDLIKDFSEIELDFSYVNEINQELNFKNFHMRKVVLIGIKYFYF